MLYKQQISSEKVGKTDYRRFPCFTFENKLNTIPFLKLEKEDVRFYDDGSIISFPQFPQIEKFDDPTKKFNWVNAETGETRMELSHGALYEILLSLAIHIDEKN